MTTFSPLESTALELVASGQAQTRAAIARKLGVAPSTASSLISSLLAARMIREEGEMRSTGGRRAVRLVACETNERSLVVELGASHALLSLVDLDGAVREPRSIPLDIGLGPEKVLQRVMTAGTNLATEAGVSVTAVGLGIPGPVEVDSGRVVSPSRMPGWHNVYVKDVLETMWGVPAVVENDARLGAVGTMAYRRHRHEPTYQDYVYVKAGSAIGGAFVVNGKVHRGSFGLAGDLTHVPVEAAADRVCRCGNRGCLDTIASAEALRQDLGFADNDSLIAAAINSDADVVNGVREAGVRLGASLAHVVSFLNPQAVIVGGTLSSIGAFLAGIRQALNEFCLPAITEHLAVEVSLSGREATLWGLAEQTNSLLTQTVKSRADTSSGSMTSDLLDPTKELL